MIQKYGVNQFKFDGLAAGPRRMKAGSRATATRCCGWSKICAPQNRILLPKQHRHLAFAVLAAVCGLDLARRRGSRFRGQGSWCQRWMTYRDAQTYANVVRRSTALSAQFPDAARHHLCEEYARELNTADDADFADEVRSFFASGTQLPGCIFTTRHCSTGKIGMRLPPRTDGRGRMPACWWIPIR